MSGGRPAASPARVRYSARAWLHSRHGGELDLSEHAEAIHLPDGFNPRIIAWAAVGLPYEGEPPR